MNSFSSQDKNFLLVIIPKIRPQIYLYLLVTLFVTQVSFMLFTFLFMWDNCWTPRLLSLHKCYGCIFPPFIFILFSILSLILVEKNFNEKKKEEEETKMKRECEKCRQDTDR